MSFSYPNGLPGGVRGSFGGFDDMNGYGAMVQYQEEYRPQIYKVSLSFGLSILFVDDSSC
jgi:hypothetical protein